MRQVIGWAIVVFLLYWMVNNPDNAAAVARSGAHGLQHAANSLSHFLNGL